MHIGACLLSAAQQNPDIRPMLEFDEWNRSIAPGGALNTREALQSQPLGGLAPSRNEEDSDEEDDLDATTMARVLAPRPPRVARRRRHRRGNGDDEDDETEGQSSSEYLQHFAQYLSNRNFLNQTIPASATAAPGRPSSRRATLTRTARVRPRPPVRRAAEAARTATAAPAEQTTQPRPAHSPDSTTTTTLTTTTTTREAAAAAQAAPRAVPRVARPTRAASTRALPTLILSARQVARATAPATTDGPPSILRRRRRAPPRARRRRRRPRLPIAPPGRPRASRPSSSDHHAPATHPASSYARLAELFDGRRPYGLRGRRVVCVSVSVSVCMCVCGGAAGGEG